MSAITPTPAAEPNDTENKPPSDDSLGYDAYAKTLWARVEQALNRDAITGKLGDDPLVVGIFGEWGAGKSFLLGRILKHAFAFEQGRIDRRKGGMLGGNAGFGLTVPVLFQPWKYEHEEHLHVPLMLHILEALKRDLAASRPISERAKASFDKGGDWLVQQMKPAVAEFEKLLVATSVATSPVTAGASLASIPAMGAVKWLLSKLPSKKPEKPNLPATIRYTNEGRYFYEIHQHLKAVTRPATEGNHAKGYTQGQQSQHDKLDINFVVFVDDLDRCLPEKAVAVLELIKTVFNVESFAFVLALDDEVIERGIGHRYRDYALGNKKSEMPITGFEYLEKIVHLPFRLPALTREDALFFIKQKEQKLLQSVTADQRAVYQPQPWFAGVPVMLPSSSSGEGVSTLHLSHLLVNSFDAYVPRKLDRAVELFHHVAKVAAERGRPLSVSTGGADVRIVFALVLIQLFQPELFRCLRRTGTGFDQLRDAFKNERLSSLASDYELLDWICYGPELRANSAALANMKDLLRESLTGVPTADTEGGQVNHLAVRNKAARLPTGLAATSTVIANLEKSLRHSSQRVRLPVVEKMLEHRAAQRHVFDVLKLFAALQESAALMPLPEQSVKPYFSWLALNPQTDIRDALPLFEVIAAPTPAPNDGRAMEPDVTDYVAEVSGATSQTNLSTVAGQSAQRVRIPELATVFDVLTSLEPREQAEVANRAGLRAGQWIDRASAADLRERSKRWLTERESSASAGGADRKAVLLRGLQHLAPHLANEDAARFWSLVNDCVTLPTKPDELVDEPKVAALYADVRSELGQENRFDPERPYIMRERFPGHREADEPIAGFVRVPSGAFIIDPPSEKGNRPRPATIDAPFYIARMLTTVGQYALFVQAKGYEASEPIWNRHGVEWLTKHTARRTPDRWDDQLAHSSRPVTNITWFEARAYAQWLSAQMRETLDEARLNAYDVRLPTEVQWARAARAKNLSEPHQGRWPWGDDASTITQRANVQSTGIDDTSTVGLFAPNAIGLHDMAGNVWEWMANRHVLSAENGYAPILSTDFYDETAHEPLALRGGSWLSRIELTGCSARTRSVPDYAVGDIGLRVVLSLAPSAKRET